MPNYRNYPIVKEIINELVKLNLPRISWSKNVLVASLNGKCQANTEPSNVCIALHFNFDLEERSTGSTCRLSRSNHA